jgi:WD40 repeat protein
MTRNILLHRCAALLGAVILAACVESTPQPQNQTIEPTIFVATLQPNAEQTDAATAEPTLIQSNIEPTPTAPSLVSTDPYLSYGPLPEGAILRISGTRPDRDNRSPLGTYYVISDAAGLRVYRISTDELVWAVRGSGIIEDAAFSSDDLWLAATMLGKLIIWNAATGEQVITLGEGDEYVRALAWSPDRTVLAYSVYSHEEQSGLFVYDLSTDQHLYTILADEQEDVDHILWTSDGTLLITAEYTHPQVNNAITIRDAATGAPIHRLAWGTEPAGAGSEGSISNIYLTPDETRLVAVYGYSGGDTQWLYQTAVVWDIASGEIVHLLNADLVWDVTFSPDGTQIAVSEAYEYGSADDRTVTAKVWDLETGSVVFNFPAIQEHENPYGVEDADWSPDGRYFAAIFDGEISVWDAASGAFVWALDDQNVGSTLYWSEDSQTLMAGGKIWDINTGLLIGTGADPTAVPGIIDDMAWSPDGSIIATISEVIALWDARTGENLRVLYDETLEVRWNGTQARSISFSQDGTLLVTASGQRISLWSMPDGVLLHTIEVEGDEFLIRDAALSPDGDQIAVVGRDTLKVLDVATGQQIGGENRADTAAVTWSPDGNSVIWTALPDYLYVWDMVSGKALNDLEIPSLDSTFLSSLAWSSDGIYLAAGSASVESAAKIVIWDIRTRTIVQTLEGQPHSIAGLAWSPDGTKLASAGGHTSADYGTYFFRPGIYDGSLILWDIAAGTPITALYGHTAEVQSVAFSPDGQYLASGSADGTVLVWDVP